VNLTELADALVAARRGGPRVDPPEHLTEDQAREVRAAILAATGAGADASYKIAGPTPAGRLFWGAVPAEHVHSSGAVVQTRDLAAPLLEPELALVVREALPMSASVEDVLDACDVAPGFELADSRWSRWGERDGMPSWRPSVELMIADNSNALLLVVGERTVARSLAEVEITAELLVDGEALPTPMGGPRPTTVRTAAERVVWLLGELGAGLPAGIAVSTGTVAAPVMVREGEVTGAFTHLSPITIDLR
jgi:2-keto-4-pentenoate hydratase